LLVGHVQVEDYDVWAQFCRELQSFKEGRRFAYKLNFSICREDTTNRFAHAFVIIG
jgi:hypothetical protein